MTSRECARVRDLLDQAMDRALPTKWRQYVAEHLQHCPECRADDTIRQRVSAELHTLALPEVPEDLLVGLHRRLALVQPIPRRRWRGLALPLAAAAAGFLVAIAVIAPSMINGRVSSSVSTVGKSTVSRLPTFAAPAALQPSAAAAIHPNGLTKGAATAASPTFASTTATVPVLSSITLLTPAPSQAVGTLSVDVAAAGGTVVAEWVPETGTFGITSAATLDVELPAQEEATLTDEADKVGRVVASAASSTGVTTQQSVTVFITILGSASSAAGVSHTWTERVLISLGTLERRWTRGI